MESAAALTSSSKCTDDLARLDNSSNVMGIWKTHPQLDIYGLDGLLGGLQGMKGQIVVHGPSGRGVRARARSALRALTIPRANPESVGCQAWYSSLPSAKAGAITRDGFAP